MAGEIWGGLGFKNVEQVVYMFQLLIIELKYYVLETWKNMPVIMKMWKGYLETEKGKEWRQME